MSYDYKKLFRENGHGPTAFIVKGYEEDGYPAHSVCHGMMKISFLDSYESEEEAIAAHPELLHDGEVQWGSKILDQDLKDVSHIPDDYIDY